MLTMTGANNNNKTSPPSSSNAQTAASSSSSSSTLQSSSNASSTSLTSTIPATLNNVAAIAPTSQYCPRIPPLCAKQNTTKCNFLSGKSANNANLYDDLLSVDTDFDAYWEEEARNPHRNRIRIGRQYQATVPPLSTHIDKEIRIDSDLETLEFLPNKIQDEEIIHYITIAKNLHKLNLPEQTKSSNAKEKSATISNPSSKSQNKNNPGFNIMDPLPLTVALENNTRRQNQTISPSEANKQLLQALNYFIGKHKDCKNSNGLCDKLLDENFSMQNKIMQIQNDLKNAISKESYAADLSLDKRKSTSAVTKKNDSETKDMKTNGTHKIPSTSDISSRQLENTAESQQTKFLTKIPNQKSKNIDALMSVYNFDETKEDCASLVESIPGTEVRPLKAKPIKPDPSFENNLIDSNLGSLNFFMDGQLVLKLNACQQEQQKEKCQWIQSKRLEQQSQEQKRSKKQLAWSQAHQSPLQSPPQNLLQTPMQVPPLNHQNIQPPNLPSLNYPMPWFPSNLAAAAAAMLLSRGPQNSQEFQQETTPVSASNSNVNPKPIDLSLDQHSSSNSAKRSGHESGLSKSRSKKTVKSSK